MTQAQREPVIAVVCSVVMITSMVGGVAAFGGSVTAGETVESELGTTGTDIAFTET